MASLQWPADTNSLLPRPQAKCECYAGASGPDCSVLGPRPNSCNSLVAINLEGMADWSRTWTWKDVMKTGRGWLSQVGGTAGQSPLVFVCHVPGASCACHLPGDGRCRAVLQLDCGE